MGIFLALISAVVWGSGDFTGGYATRRSHQYHVLTLSALSGLLVLIAAALVTREAFLSPRGMVWAMLAGISGAVGIAGLYRALSTGHAALVAPITGVIAAVLPVLYGIVITGWPAPTQLLGFALALAGIWLVSSANSATGSATRQEFLLACLAGVGFGGFMIFLGQVEPGKIFTPLIVARTFTLLTGVLLVLRSRLPLPALRGNFLALLAGLLDAGGNLFYILAKQYVRLDIAAVLSSLYPAATVLLAALLLKERVARRQWLGLILCLAAIALITL